MFDKLNNKSKDELTLLIDGKEIIVESAKLLRTMDTAADAFSCVMPWEPGLDPDVDRVTKPYSYLECGIYVGGTLQMVGLLYNVAHKRDSSGTIKNLEIFSKTANIIDSSVRFPFETNNMNLLERCESQMNSSVAGRNLEIDVIVDSGVDVGGKFKRITAEQTDNCFEKLKELATQRGLILSCTKKGELLITKAKTTGSPVGTIEENNSQAESYEISFNGRNRFKNYEAIASSAKKGTTRKKQRSADPVVTTPRFLTFSADDSLPGEAVDAAEWQKNKSAAESLNLNFPVNSWYAPNGQLWEPNTLVVVKSPTIGISKGYTFLITQVEFQYEKDGTTATLQLKPPSVYTTGDIDEPWL